MTLLRGVRILQDGLSFMARKDREFDLHRRLRLSYHDIQVFLCVKVHVLCCRIT